MGSTKQICRQLIFFDWEIQKVYPTSNKTFLAMHYLCKTKDWIHVANFFRTTWYLFQLLPILVTSFKRYPHYTILWVYWKICKLLFPITNSACLGPTVLAIWYRSITSSSSKAWCRTVTLSWSLLSTSSTRNTAGTPWSPISPQSIWNIVVIYAAAKTLLLDLCKRL